MSVTALPITVAGLKNLLAYSRDSSERLLGIFGQEDEIRHWGQENGYEVVGYARDGITARTAPIAREGFHAALGMLSSPDVHGLVVHRLDRLARDVEPMLDAIERVWDTGSDVYATDLGRIPRGKKGREVAIQAAMRGRSELDAILQRLADGKRAAAARGEYVGGFTRRIGAEVRDGRWQPLDDEQRLIRRLCLACPDGRGYQRMAEQLNAEGVPTVTGKGRWHAKTVRSAVLRGSQALVMVADIAAPVTPSREPVVLGRREWART